MSLCFNGCSFTFGIPPVRRHERYSFLVSNHYGVTENNISKNGASNDDIVNRSINYLEENTVGYALFTALRKATDLQQKLIIDGMSFARIEIELGLTPVVRLSYKPM